MKIGWGKSTHLPQSISVAVANGASRNVYIGFVDETVTRDALHEEYAVFGEIELVNMIPEKKIAFVSFTDITSAIKAVEHMRQKGNKRVNFGKDRCANPPRTKSLFSPPSTPVENSP